MFPTRFTVWLYAFNAGAQDELGNDAEAWATTGVEHRVIGWQPTKTTEVLTGEVLGTGSSTYFASRSITLVDLQVPPDFGPYKMRDRVKLPNGLMYEVVGGVNNDGGFHGWNPGGVIQLKRVED